VSRAPPMCTGRCFLAFPCTVNLALCTLSYFHMQGFRLFTAQDADGIRVAVPELLIEAIASSMDRTSCRSQFESHPHLESPQT